MWSLLLNLRINWLDDATASAKVGKTYFLSTHLQGLALVHRTNQKPFVGVQNGQITMTGSTLLLQSAQPLVAGLAVS